MSPASKVVAPGKPIMQYVATSVLRFAVDWHLYNFMTSKTRALRINGISVVTKGPHTRSNKFAQQRFVQQETVSVHDTISLRKLQSFGKSHNENMSKAACLAIISRGFSTSSSFVPSLKLRFLYTWLFTFHNSGSDRYNCVNSRQNSLFAVVCDIFKRRFERYENQWWTGDVIRWQTCPYTLQTVAQPDCCATKFKHVWKSSNCCTNSQTTPHTIKQFAQQPVLRKLFDRVWGP
jgi:hypothetical protein